ncbi:hypothetical protein D9M68_987570 [compost metagenome]
MRLGAGDVRAALEQLRRHAAVDSRSNQVFRQGSGQAQRLRRNAQQHAQRHFAFVQLLTQAGYRDSLPRHQRTLLGQFQRHGGAGAFAGLQGGEDPLGAR